MLTFMDICCAFQIMMRYIKSVAGAKIEDQLFWEATVAGVCDVKTRADYVLEGSAINAKLMYKNGDNSYQVCG